MTYIYTLVVGFGLYFTVSVVSILCLFFLKNPTAQKVAFYFTAVWGMYLAYFTTTFYSSDQIMESMLAWIIGFIAVIGILVRLKANTPKLYKAAQILVAVSVAGGFINMFFSPSVY